MKMKSWISIMSAIFCHILTVPWGKSVQLILILEILGRLFRNSVFVQKHRLGKEKKNKQTKKQQQTSMVLERFL
jgi:hypothetical protein